MSPQGRTEPVVRGTTRACAVWTRAVDPGDIEADFHKLIDGSKHPGLNLTVVEDKILPSPAGQLHELVYQMSATDSATGFVFTLLTAENPGGAFQASLQVAAARISKAYLDHKPTARIDRSAFRSPVFSFACWLPCSDLWPRITD
ncbi:NMCC_0638 family (lipo)protein [Paraburkholderia sediminicola]|uniref:NMCC_0638 family (lipo)protein n=1 Tax=Paraburkholderia sediminicola TaxID=458836 RepID=UPI0038BB36DF